MTALDVPFVRVAVGGDEAQAAADAVRSGWLTAGPRVRALADAFRDWLGSGPVLPTASATAATHIALQAAGVGAGDAVFLPAISFVGPANVAHHLGASAFLVDVDDDTCNLSAAALELAAAAAQRRGLRPAAVVPVHLWGHPADMDAICHVADRYGLFVLEDCAHAAGAYHDDGGHVGSSRGANRAAVFSGYATKNWTCGEGGLLVCGSDELAERCRPLVLHGMTATAHERAGASGGRGWSYDVTAPGWKANMTEVAAAIGLVQLDRLPAMQARRWAIAARYTEGLRGLAGLRLPTVRAGCTPAWHVYAVRVAGDRDAFMAALAECGVGTDVHFPPLHHFTAHRDLPQAGGLGVAEHAATQLVSLPLYPDLTDAHVDHVVTVVQDVAGALCV